MNKPSPVTSILLFAGAVLLLYASVSASWFSYGSNGFSSSAGLIRAELCEEGTCRSMTIFSGGGRIGGLEILTIMTFLMTLAGAVMAGVAGLLLLRPGKTVMSVLAMCFVGAAGLFGLVVIGRVAGKGPHMSYGAFAFFVGFAAALTGSIMGMARKGPPRMQPIRPGMPYPPHAAQMPPYGQPYGAPNPYGAQPQPRGPSPYSPQGAPATPYSPQPQAAAHGAPCATCATPTTWVAQYNRWFCARCQKYV